VLLVDDVLKPSLAVARAWRVRERVEREAARWFAGLAGGLRGAGFGAQIVQLAEQGAADERDHAERCRRIVEAHHAGLEPSGLPAQGRIGPAELQPRQRVIYEAVALSCVTETLSVALLGTMRPLITDGLVAETVHHILEDEIAHARLGWAVLAAEAKRGSVAWLAPHVPAMVRAALEPDGTTLDRPASGEDLSAYGVLTRPRVDAAVRETLDQVILPGLRSFEIVVEVS
jgi:hypothetical protein